MSLPAIHHCWRRCWDVCNPLSLTCVFANSSDGERVETLRRHIFKLLLRQQRRCGVKLADCCCGSRDVAASHSQTAVAAAETLRRHTRRLLLRQQRRCSFQNSPLSSGGASVVQASTVKAVSQGSASVSVCGVGFRRFDGGAKSSKSVATCDRVANWRGQDHTSVPRPQHSGVIDLRGGCALFGRQAAWRLGMSSCLLAAVCCNDCEGSSSCLASGAHLTSCVCRHSERVPLSWDLSKEGRDLR